MRIMKTVLMTLVLLAMPLVSQGGPAYPSPFVATLADGSRVTLQLVGDEHGHAWCDVATGTLYTYDAATAAYAPMSAAAAEQHTARAAQRRSEAKAAVRQAIEGERRGLIILADFSDRHFDAAHTPERIARLYNEVGYSEDGHIGSVRDYFHDQSYGRFDLTFDIVGPVTVSNRMAYYGQNDSNGNDRHAGAFVAEACRLAAEAGTDFSPYDWDGDGEVDQVVVFYAGYGENFTSAEVDLSACIWPQEFALSKAQRNGDGPGALTLGGVRVDTYACVPELSGATGNRLTTIGASCHEFSHCLGFPDFYDTKNGTQYGMYLFDLMGYGNYGGPDMLGEVPCGFTAYERWMAGWIEPTVLTEPSTIEGMQPLEADGTAYLIPNPATADEYLLIENRQRGRWFSYVGPSTACHGLFVTHVDYNAVEWKNNTVNIAKARQRMTFIPAGGAYGKSVGTFAGMYFPGSGGVDALTPTSHNTVAGAWRVGSSALGHSLTAITEHDDGTVDFLYDGGRVPTPTVGSLIETINAVYDERATLRDVDRMVDRILER